MRKKQTVQQRKTEDTAEVQEFVVDKIIRRRVLNGRVEYFMKWKGFTDAENTWEPEDNLGCPELIEEFLRNADFSEENEEDQSEQEFILKEEMAEQETESSPQQAEDFQSDKDFQSEDEPSDSDSFTKLCNYPDPECIIGSTDKNGELMFLVKWKMSGDVALLSAQEASFRWPQVVINFYEQRLTWQCQDHEEQ